MTLSTATTHIEIAFRRNRFLHVLIGLFLVGWTAGATAPHDRADWIMENLMLDMTLARGAVYGLIEWAAAARMSPALAAAYLGAQGDLWGAQKDMLAAATGAVLTMVATAGFSAQRRRPALLGS